MAEIEVRQKQNWQEERKNLMSQKPQNKADFDRVTDRLVNRDAKNAIKVDHRLGRRIKRGLDGMFGGKKS